MSDLKRIEDITIEDLAAHRWCYYQNDEDGYDAFEHVISDCHPDFSQDIAELEFAEFEFSNGKTAHGLYDDSGTFNIIISGQWYPMWYGVARPEDKDVERLSSSLSRHDFKLPVIARAK